MNTQRALQRLKLKRPAPLAHVSLNHLIPNAVTLLSLCAGLSAIRFGLLLKYEYALFALMAAGICDTLDGRLARLLKGTSHFGAELDSLADVISFGVAPAMIMYLWAFQDAGPFGWIAVLVFACCSALRLARFNTVLDAPNPPPFAASFFTGVPTPAGAALAVAPLVLSVGLVDNGYGSLADAHWLLIPWMILVGSLMVSRLPTYSFKKMKISRDIAIVILLCFVLVVALLFTKPWLGMALLLGAYITSLPLAFWHYRKLSRALTVTQD